MNDEQDAQIRALQQLETAVKSVMTKEALERFGTVKVAHPEKAMQVIMFLGQLLKAGRISQVTDETLKSVLLQLEPKKRETKIRGI